MKYIIPLSQSDINRAHRHAHILKHFGGFEDRDLIYFTAPSVEEQAHEIAAINGGRVLGMEMEPSGGWPIAPNQQFSALVLLLGSMGSTDHFLWMETDMLPLRKGWQSALEDELVIKGTPFMGSVVPFGMSRNGKIHYEDGDTMMMGCGVYPPHMHADERIRWAILNLGKQGMANPRVNGHTVGFDVYLREPMRAFGVSDTKLISDQWNTGKYAIGKDGLHCEALPFDRPHRQRGGLISPAAVLVHGCKDGTLEKLLLGSYAAPVERVYVESVKVAAPAPVEKFEPTTSEDWVNTIVTHGTSPAEHQNILPQDNTFEDTGLPDIHIDEEPRQEEQLLVTTPYEAPHVPTALSVPPVARPHASPLDGLVDEPFDSIDWDLTMKIASALKKAGHRPSSLAKAVRCERRKLERDLGKLGFHVSGNGWIKPMPEMIAALTARKNPATVNKGDGWFE